MIKTSLETGHYRIRNLVLFSCIVFSVCYFSFLNNLVDILERTEKEEQVLKSSFRIKQKKYRNLESYKHQQLQIIKALDFYVKALPDEINIDKERLRIVNLAKQYDLSVTSLEFYNQKNFEFYNSLPFFLNVSGSFNDIYYFLYDVFYSSNRVASMHNFSIIYLESKKSLNLKIDGKLYGYIK